jgi:hypothetical protein
VVLVPDVLGDSDAVTVMARTLMWLIVEIVSGLAVAGAIAPFVIRVLPEGLRGSGALFVLAVVCVVLAGVGRLYVLSRRRRMDR